MFKNPLKDIKERLDELEIDVGIKEEEKENSDYGVYSPYGLYGLYSGFMSKTKLYKRIDKLEETLELLLKHLKLEKTTQKARTFYRKKK